MCRAKGVTMARSERHKKKKSGVQFFLSFLIIVCAGVFLFAGYKLVGELKEYKVGEDTYDTIADAYVSSVDDIEKILSSDDFMQSVAQEVAKESGKLTGNNQENLSPSVTKAPSNQGGQGVIPLPTNQPHQGSEPLQTAAGATATPGANPTSEGQPAEPDNQGQPASPTNSNAPAMIVGQEEKEPEQPVKKGIPYTNGPIDFVTLKQDYPDVVGWIYVPNTDINYGIVQGKDNKEYLHALMDGKYNKAGSIFMDYESEADFTGEHTVIYGHNMRSGKMFAKLNQYKEQEYFEENPYIIVFLEDRILRLRVVSAYPAKAHSSQRQMIFSDRQEFEGYVQNVLNQCEYSITLDPTKVTQLYTFATCSYEWNDTRTYVHAVYYDEVPLEVASLNAAN